MVTLTAAPAADANFSGFTGGGCSGTGTTCMVTMDAAKTVTATFVLKSRTLTVTKAGTGSGTVTSSPVGIDCGADCTQDYDDGVQVNLVATPASGSTFAGFSGPGCSGTGVCTVTMDQARTVTATFTAIPAAAATTTAAARRAAATTAAADRGAAGASRRQPQRQRVADTRHAGTVRRSGRGAG